MRIAAALREAGIGVEVYPEPKRLGTQLGYADRRGHRLAVIAGPHEREQGVVQVKDLADGSTYTMEATAAVARIVALLDR